MSIGRQHRQSYLAGYRQALADIQAGRSRAGKALGRTAHIMGDERVRVLLALRELTAIIGDPNWSGQEEIDAVIRRRLIDPARQSLADLGARGVLLR
jgi:hypothetical protein